MEAQPPRRAQITDIQARRALKPPLSLALDLSHPLRLHVSRTCGPAAAQGTLNTPNAFQPADLSSCSLTCENPSSSRSSLVDGEVMLTKGVGWGGVGSRVLGAVPTLSLGSLCPVLQPPGTSDSSPTLTVTHL